MSAPLGMLHGVLFTSDQWDAVRTDPPIWELNPPQREDVETEKDYSLALRDYAERVIAYKKSIPTKP